MKRILFLLTLALFAFSGCKNKDRISISGVINGEKKEYIHLSRLNVNIPVLIDSSKIGRNGTFKFRIKAKEADFYQLGYSSADFITLLAEPGEKIDIVFDGKNLFEKYSVNGSPGSEKLRALDADLAVTRRKLDSLSTLYSSESSKPGFETKAAGLEDQFTSILKDQRRKNIVFIINNITSLASIKALYQKIDKNTYVLYDVKDLQYLKIVTDSLTKYYPGSKHVQALASDFSKEMNQMYANRLRAMADTIPETKLDPDLKTIEGKRIALSSLRGKFVLLTFWSVRSKDCIEENLRLKEFYKKYKAKGFEIYQINIDPNESDWRAAVKFDELPWISTREDDPEELLNTRIFNVKSVPSNFLFDRQGKIVATNLHGRALQIKLDQLFN